jgi:hypothetical protein
MRLKVTFIRNPEIEVDCRLICMDVDPCQRAESPPASREREGGRVGGGRQGGREGERERGRERGREGGRERERERERERDLS